jgi:diguanylate cyclase (GGDEF)-like protein/PAS domain S-box-containing protein
MKLDTVKDAEPNAQERDIPFPIYQLEQINVLGDTLKIVLAYAVFGVLWVLVSNRAIQLLFPDPAVYTKVLTFKGWLFVMLTSLVIFMLVFRRMHLLRHVNKKVIDGYEQLTAAYEEIIATEDELRKQKDLIDTIIENTPAMIVISDEDKNVLRMNSFALKILGYTIDEICNKHSNLYVKSTTKIESNVYESKLITKSDDVLDVLWNVNIIDNANSPLHGKTISVGTDITERKGFEEQLNNLAFYDPLTGLVNKAMFEIEMDKLIKRGGNYKFALVYMDIDNFKYINDSLGHNAGDTFLQYIAISLQRAVAPSHIVARLGGDEFAVILKDVNDKDMIINIIEDIKYSIGNVWNLHQFDFYVTLSIGIVQYPVNGLYAAELIKNADIAMYKAKHEGKNRYVFFSDGIQEDNLARINIINQLQRAIDNPEFMLLYQPQFNLITKQIIGVEALIRWNHPERGFISPTEFIPLAEETGQIFDIERWVFEQAILQKQAWEGLEYPAIDMSINLSSRTLTNDNHFAKLEAMLHLYDFNKSELVIEITETAFITDMQKAVEKLERLKERGIRIALDDFGTGYSSLTYLKDLPIDQLKLDRAFISNAGEIGKECLIVKSILQLAKELPYQVVAEGIETEKQLDYLIEFGCEIGQGYIFNKPITAEELCNTYFLVENKKTRAQTI